jgi:hypothetical protein
VRWQEETPAIGVDPDVCVLAPPPPEGDELTSLRLWRPGHVPQVLAVEVVSASRADKDYAQSPDKYAANGTGELWIFDPKLAGPKAKGGPFRIQVWRRDDEGDFCRVYSGEGPAWSEAVQGFLHAVDGGRALALCDDEQGTRFWLSAEEAEGATEETERAAKEEAQRRAERLAEKLLALGVDPDELGRAPPGLPGGPAKAGRSPATVPGGTATAGRFPGDGARRAGNGGQVPGNGPRRAGNGGQVPGSFEEGPGTSASAWKRRASAGELRAGA